jgi:hypothetical protein
MIRQPPYAQLPYHIVDIYPFSSIKLENRKRFLVQIPLEIIILIKRLLRPEILKVLQKKLFVRLEPLFRNIKIEAVADHVVQKIRGNGYREDYLQISAIYC